MLLGFSWSQHSGSKRSHHHIHFQVCPLLKSLQTMRIFWQQRLRKDRNECLVSNSSVNNPLFRISTSLEKEGKGTPLQYSCLENPMDGGARSAAVHGIATSRTRLSDFTFTFHFYALEKEMATHSSVLAWRIPGTGEPGGLQSMGSLRVGHD